MRYVALLRGELRIYVECVNVSLLVPSRGKTSESPLSRPLSPRDCLVEWLGLFHMWDVG